MRLQSRLFAAQNRMEIEILILLAGSGILIQALLISRSKRTMQTTSLPLDSSVRTASIRRIR